MAWFLNFSRSSLPSTIISTAAAAAAAAAAASTVYSGDGGVEGAFMVDCCLLFSLPLCVCVCVCACCFLVSTNNAGVKC